MSPREARIFACLTEIVVDPAPPLPPVVATDAVSFFGRYLALSPAPNRAVLRAALHLIDGATRPLGFKAASLRALPAARRAQYLARLERGPLEPVVTALRGLAQLSYYGDEQVMALLGYDAGPRVQRGRELRERDKRW